MPRRPRDAKLETREGRKSLKQRKEPYWRQIHSGLYIGYYKGAKASSWVVRTWEGGQNNSKKIGIANDFADSDGRTVLSYGEAVKVALEGGIVHQRAARDHEKYTVAECIADYMTDYSVRGKAIRDTERKLNLHVLPKFGKRPVASLSANELQKWLNALVEGRTKSTANRIWNSFRAALNFAYRQDRVDSDRAWRKVRSFKHADRSVERFLTKAEAQRLLNAATVHFRPLIRAGLLTGCRWGELSSMLCGAYNPDAGTVTVAESKSGRARHIPLTDEGRNWFDLWTAGKKRGERVFSKSSGEPWGTSHQIRPMREACERAKIDPPAGFHILRHTYGSLLVMEGVPLQVVAKALGHADTRMTEKHYAHLQPNYVSETIRQHLPSFGDSTSNVKDLTRG